MWGITIWSISTSDWTNGGGGGSELALGGGRVEACDVGGGGAIALVLGWTGWAPEPDTIISPTTLLVSEHSAGGAGAIAFVFVCVVADILVWCIGGGGALGLSLKGVKTVFEEAASVCVDKPQSCVA